MFILNLINNYIFIANIFFLTQTCISDYNGFHVLSFIVLQILLFEDVMPFFRSKITNRQNTRHFTTSHLRISERHQPIYILKAVQKIVS